MNSTRNVLVLAAHLVFAGLAFICFLDGRLTLEQFAAAMLAAQMPSLFALKRGEEPPPPSDDEKSDYRVTVGKGGGPGGGSASSRVLLVGFPFALVLACGSPPAPSAPSEQTEQTAETVAEGSCKILEAVTANAIVKAVCANADELADAVAVIATMRDKPSPAMPTKARPPCKAIPSTNICATNDELLEAIDRILEKRRHTERKHHVKPVIAFINETTVLADTECPRVVAALQKQVSGDIAPVHGTDAELVFISKGGHVPRDVWQVPLLDNSDQADALGYHDVTSRGRPLGKVFVKTTISAGGIWTVTASHELAEMLGDPSINKVATRDLRNGMRLYAYELSDAVEADELGYEIDGVQVSDFVTPEWFDPYITHSKPTSFKGHVKGAFELAPGGYIGYFDVTGGGGWQQEVKDARARRYARAHIGSRRERRRVSREHWQQSTAHADAHQEG